MRLPKFLFIPFLILILAFSGLTAPSAHALSPKAKTIIRSALWGVAIGTGVGLLTYPLHQSVKGIFLGSSVGLYGGLGFGAYQAFSGDTTKLAYRFVLPVARF